MAADKKITELPLASTLIGVELFEIVQGGVNKKSPISDIIAAPDFIQTTVATSGGTITLAMASKERAYLTGVDAIDDDKNVGFSGDSRATELDWMFEISDIDAILTFGPNTTSSAAVWGTEGDKTWKAGDLGIYRMHGTKMGSNWLLDFFYYSDGVPSGGGDGEGVEYDDGSPLEYDDSSQVEYE